MTTNPIPIELYTFLKEWNQWRLAGAESGKPFFRALGLCSNVEYSKELKTSDQYSAARQLKESLMQDFDLGHLMLPYPFGSKDYKQRRRHATQHLCEKRIEWVQEKIRVYEEWREEHGTTFWHGA